MQVVTAACKFNLHKLLRAETHLEKEEGISFFSVSVVPNRCAHFPSIKDTAALGKDAAYMFITELKMSINESHISLSSVRPKQLNICIKNSSCKFIYAATVTYFRSCT